MKAFLMGLSLIAIAIADVGCAGFGHGLKCAYVDCVGQPELDNSYSARASYGAGTFGQSADGRVFNQMISNAETRDPEFAERVKNAASDDDLIITERRTKSGRRYFRAH